MSEPFDINVKKISHLVQISDTLAMDFGLIPDARPAPPPPTRRQRFRRWQQERRYAARMRLASWIARLRRNGLRMTEQSDTWLLIDVACAECRGWGDDALVTIQGVYPTAQAAKDAYESHTQPQKWLSHPQGGEFAGFSSGDVWVAPVTAFTEPKVQGDGVGD